jgi:hypothetical protein
MKVRSRKKKSFRNASVVHSPYCYYFVVEYILMKERATKNGVGRRGRARSADDAPGGTGLISTPG